MRPAQLEPAGSRPADGQRFLPRHWWQCSGGPSHETRARAAPPLKCDPPATGTGPCSGCTAGTQAAPVGGGGIARAFARGFATSGACPSCGNEATPVMPQGVAPASDSPASPMRPTFRARRWAARPSSLGREPTARRCRKTARRIRVGPACACSRSSAAPQRARKAEAAQVGPVAVPSRHQQRQPRRPPCRAESRQVPSAHTPAPSLPLAAAIALAPSELAQAERSPEHTAMRSAVHSPVTSAARHGRMRPTRRGRSEGGSAGGRSAGPIECQSAPARAGDLR